MTPQQPTDEIPLRIENLTQLPHTTDRWCWAEEAFRPFISFVCHSRICRKLEIVTKLWPHIATL
jgi:hypothetical protein